MRALTIAAVLLLAGAPNAAAGGANGLLVSNTDFNCFSLATGSPYVEPMVSAIVGWGSKGEMPAAASRSPPSSRSGSSAARAAARRSRRR